MSVGASYNFHCYSSYFYVQLAVYLLMIAPSYAIASYTCTHTHTHTHTHTPCTSQTSEQKLS